MSSDIEHWYINATVYKDRVEEVHYISDPAKNIRRKPQTKVWQVERYLGRGSFGEVRLETNKEDGRARAVKRIATTTTSLSNKECEKELKALLEFSKPKSREAAVFVDFLGWFKDGSDVFLAMEYVQLGDLETNVVTHSGRLPESEVREITEQILSGLQIMHAESFAHRDLKPQNVLVVHGPPQWWIKLADFGLSKRLTETTTFHTRSGTQSYMAPEMLNYLGASQKYTYAVDIWAVGCIAYRLVAGCIPFPPGPTLLKYCEDKSLFPYDALFDSGIKSHCSKFLRQLLVADPSGRLSASEALQHQWIGQKSDTYARPFERSSTPEIDGMSELEMSKLSFDTASHLGLKSRESSSNLNTVIVPRSSYLFERSQEPPPDLSPTQTQMRENAYDERQKKNTPTTKTSPLRPNANLGRSVSLDRSDAADKLYSTKKKTSSRQPFFEDSSSDEEYRRSRRIEDERTRDKLVEDDYLEEKHQRNKDAEAKARNMEEIRLRQEQSRAKAARVAQRAGIGEAPSIGKWWSLKVEDFVRGRKRPTKQSHRRAGAEDVEENRLRYPKWLYAEAEDEAEARERASIKAVAKRQAAFFPYGNRAV